jgi:hypothetical protein
VAYWTGTSAQSGSNNLFWDNANGRLGIGTNVPSDQLHISNSAVLVNTVVKLSVHPNHANIINFRNADNSVQGGFLATGSSFSFGTYTTNQANLLGGSGGIGLRVLNTSASSLVVYGGNASADLGVKYLQVYGNTGNVLIQNGGTFTDSGERLQVTGDVLINGTSPYVHLKPSAWGSTGFYIQGGISVNGQTAGSYGLFLVPTNRGYSFCQGSNVSMVLMPTTYNVLINTTTDVPSSKLTIQSTTQGFLPPRMTTTQKNAISSPAAGLVVYDTTLAKLCVYTTAWETITSI